MCDSMCMPKRGGRFGSLRPASVSYVWRTRRVQNFKLSVVSTTSSSSAAVTLDSTVVRYERSNLIKLNINLQPTRMSSHFSTNRVTRFGVIFGHFGKKNKSLWIFLEVSFCIWQNFVPTLESFILFGNF